MAVNTENCGMNVYQSLEEALSVFRYPYGVYKPVKYAINPVRCVEAVLCISCLGLAVLMLVLVTYMSVAFKIIIIVTAASFTAITIVDLISNTYMNPIYWNSWVLFSVTASLLFFLCVGALLATYTGVTIALLISEVFNGATAIVFLMDAILVLNAIRSRRVEIWPEDYAFPAPDFMHKEFGEKSTQMPISDESMMMEELDEKSYIISEQDYESMEASAGEPGDLRVAEIVSSRASKTSRVSRPPVMEKQRSVISYGGTFPVSKDEAPLPSPPFDESRRMTGDSKRSSSVRVTTSKTITARSREPSLRSAVTSIRSTPEYFKLVYKDGDWYTHDGRKAPKVYMGPDLQLVTADKTPLNIISIDDEKSLYESPEGFLYSSTGEPYAYFDRSLERSAVRPQVAEGRRVSLKEYTPKLESIKEVKTSVTSTERSIRSAEPSIRSAQRPIRSAEPSIRSATSGRSASLRDVPMTYRELIYKDGEWYTHDGVKAPKVYTDSEMQLVSAERVPLDEIKSDRGERLYESREGFLYLPDGEPFAYYDVRSARSVSRQPSVQGSIRTAEPSIRSAAPSAKSAVALVTYHRLIQKDGKGYTHDGRKAPKVYTGPNKQLVTANRSPLGEIKTVEGKTLYESPEGFLYLANGTPFAYFDTDFVISSLPPSARPAVREYSPYLDGVQESLSESSVGRGRQIKSAEPSLRSATASVKSVPTMYHKLIYHQGKWYTHDGRQAPKIYTDSKMRLVTVNGKPLREMKTAEGKNLYEGPDGFLYLSNGEPFAYFDACCSIVSELPGRPSIREYTPSCEKIQESLSDSSIGRRERSIRSTAPSYRETEVSYRESAQPIRSVQPSIRSGQPSVASFRELEPSIGRADASIRGAESSTVSIDRAVSVRSAHSAVRSEPLEYFKLIYLNGEWFTHDGRKAPRVYMGPNLQLITTSGKPLDVIRVGEEESLYESPEGFLYSSTGEPFGYFDRGVERTSVQPSQISEMSTQPTSERYISRIETVQESVSEGSLRSELPSIREPESSIRHVTPQPDSKSSTVLVYKKSDYIGSGSQPHVETSHETTRTSSYVKDQRTLSGTRRIASRISDREQKSSSAPVKSEKDSATAFQIEQKPEVVYQQSFKKPCKCGQTHYGTVSTTQGKLYATPSGSGAPFYLQQDRDTEGEKSPHLQPITECECEGECVCDTKEERWEEQHVATSSGQSVCSCATSGGISSGICTCCNCRIGSPKAVGTDAAQTSETRILRAQDVHRINLTLGRTDTHRR